MKLIKIDQTPKYLSIAIPIELLRHVCESHPETPLKIIDDKKFLALLREELESYKDSNTGLSGLHQLIDDSIERLQVNAGDDIIELLD